MANSLSYTDPLKQYFLQLINQVHKIKLGEPIKIFKDNLCLRRKPPEECCGVLTSRTLNATSVRLLLFDKSIQSISKSILLRRLSQLSDS